MVVYIALSGKLQKEAHFSVSVLLISCSATNYLKSKMYPLTDWRNSISRINFTELPLSKDIKHMYCIVLVKSWKNYCLLMVIKKLKSKSLFPNGCVYYASFLLLHISTSENTSIQCQNIFGIWEKVSGSVCSLYTPQWSLCVV